MTKAEARIKGATFLLHGRGIFPSPAALADFLEIRRGAYRWHNGGYDSKFVGTPAEHKAAGRKVPSGIWQDGRTARWRREALAELGYGRHLLTGRFHTPEVVAANPAAYESPAAAQFVTYRERIERLATKVDSGVFTLAELDPYTRQLVAERLDGVYA